MRVTRRRPPSCPSSDGAERGHVVSIFEGWITDAPHFFVPCRRWRRELSEKKTRLALTEILRTVAFVSSKTFLAALIPKRHPAQGSKLKPAKFFSSCEISV
ncbi:hypothetical protein MRX96_019761 [Rhipicephalus microplus]